jgi:hypothetical protein
MPADGIGAAAMREDFGRSPWQLTDHSIRRMQHTPVAELSEGWIACITLALNSSADVAPIAPSHHIALASNHRWDDGDNGLRACRRQWLRCTIHETIGSPPRRRRKRPIE